MEANDKWESMPSKPKLTIVFGLALLLVVSFITYVTVYAADGRGNVGKDSNPDTVILHEDTAHDERDDAMHHLKLSIVIDVQSRDIYRMFTCDNDSMVTP